MQADLVFKYRSIGDAHNGSLDSTGAASNSGTANMDLMYFLNNVVETNYNYHGWAQESVTLGFGGSLSLPGIPVLDPSASTTTGPCDWTSNGELIPQYDSVIRETQNVNANGSLAAYMYVMATADASVSGCASGWAKASSHTVRAEVLGFSFDPVPAP